MEESLKFYRDILKLDIVNRFNAGPGVEIVFLGKGETKVELIYDANNRDIEMCNNIALGFGVDSLDQMMDFVKAKGIDIHSGPFEPNPNTRFFFVQDPNGLRIQFVEES